MSSEESHLKPFGRDIHVGKRWQADSVAKSRHDRRNGWIALAKETGGERRIRMHIRQKLRHQSC